MYTRVMYSFRLRLQTEVKEFPVKELRPPFSYNLLLRGDISTLTADSCEISQPRFVYR